MKLPCASLALLAAVPLPAACAQQDSEETPSGPEADEPSDAEIFSAAGFHQNGETWGKCEDPGTASYESGAIYRRGDFNGDGLTDAFVTEGGTYCFGATGTGYTLVSRQADGSWRVMDENIGIPELLSTTGTDGWPDIQVGGPGFCFPVNRWDGTQYARHRAEYEGKACQL